MKHLFILMLSICSVKMQAQTDTLRILSLESFLSIVKKYHPVAQQADLLTEQGKANLRITRGGFDPLLSSEFNSKQFYGNNYYSFFSSELKIPSWYGIEVKTGYDLNYGLNINPENNLPSEGMYYLGVSVSVLRNMIIDKRRADLKKAKLFQQSNEQERVLMLNELLFESLQSYYRWCEQYQIKKIIDSAAGIAYQRLQNTVRSYQLGDKSAIDTTEALAQYQTRLLQLNDARVEYQKAGLDVAGFLWNENNSPYELSSDIAPEILDSSYIQPMLYSTLGKLEDLLVQLNSSHPIILQYKLKLKQLEVDKKLKVEALKPNLNINYNLLSPGFYKYTSPENKIFTNYYKLGFNFSMPLTLSQGRGELTLAKIKITETKLLLTQKQRDLEIKLVSCYADIVMLKKQVFLYREALKSYQRLLDGEIRRFQIGEGNLFLVNSRENTSISAQLKLIELQMKYLQNESKFKWILTTLLQ